MVRNIDVDKIPMFFILGRPRSGTTLLASLFDAHPSVVLPFECPFIINIQSKYSSVFNWNEGNLKQLASDIFQQRKFDSWRISESELSDYLLEFIGSNSFETIIKAVYLKFNSFFDKKDIAIIGDKNPVYSIYPAKLKKLFPDAKFIHLTRDYRDNILSIKKVDFEAPVTALLAFRWQFAEKRIFRVKEKFPNSFYTLKYEDLVTNPGKYLKSICSFLEIEYDESVLDFHKKQDVIFKDFDKDHIIKYHSSLLKPISNDKIYGWKSDMAEKDVRIADTIVGKYADYNGYERKYNRSIFPGFVSLIWIFYGYFSYFQRFVVDILPFRIKMRIRNKGPLMAILFNRYFIKKNNV